MQERIKSINMNITKPSHRNIILNKKDKDLVFSCSCLLCYTFWYLLSVFTKAFSGCVSTVFCLQMGSWLWETVDGDTSTHSYIYHGVRTGAGNIITVNARAWLIIAIYLFISINLSHTHRHRHTRTHTHTHTCFIHSCFSAMLDIYTYYIFDVL